MNIVTICAISVITSVLAIFLKRYNSEYSLVLSIGAVVLILILIITSSINSFDEIEKIIAGSNISKEYISILIRCVGVCFLSEFSSECCKDSSQNSLSSVVLISGRICVLITAFPMFLDFFSIALKLSGGGV